MVGVLETKKSFGGVVHIVDIDLRAIEFLVLFFVQLQFDSSGE